jgi:hypothetical protein
VRRYFLTPQESGELCLMSCLLGQNRDLLFPKLDGALHLTRFSDLAVRYLAQMGYEAVQCDSEDEARGRAPGLIAQRKWPCYFFASDTTGEKGAEEFYMEGETLDMERFARIGVIRSPANYDGDRLDRFGSELARIRSQPSWGKAELVALFKEVLPGFAHMETGKYLDDRM